MCKHPDTRTAEELSTYQPGWECSCPGFVPQRCRCGANWTPREVYELRNMVQDLENQLSKQTELLVAAGVEIARAGLRVQQAEANKSDLETTEKLLQSAEALIAGLGIASKAMLSKETRLALYHEARKQADDQLYGHDRYYEAPTSDYALEA